MRLSQLFVELRLSAENFNNGLRNAQRDLKDFQKTVAPTSKMLKEVETQSLAAGKALTVAVTAPLVAVGLLGIRFNAMQQSAHIAFTQMLGDATKASAKLNELKDFAAKTPFEFPDLVRATQRMQAMGIAADKVMPMLTSVGDAVSAMGGGAAEIDKITLALAQMEGRGRVATQEMNQLTEHGIPAWEILAEAMGKPIPVLRAMVEQGAVPASEALDDLIEGMNKRFAGMMAKQQEGFTGLFSTIKDEARFLAGELTEGFFNQLQKPMDALADAMHDLRVEMDDLDDSTKTFVAGFVILAAAAGPVLLIFGTLAGSVRNLITLYGELKPAITAVQIALAELGLVSIGWAAATVAAGVAIGGAIGLLTNYLTEGTKVEKWIDFMTTQIMKSWVGQWDSTTEALEIAAFTANATAKAVERLSVAWRLPQGPKQMLSPDEGGAKGIFAGFSGEIGTVGDVLQEILGPIQAFRDAVDGVKESVLGNAQADRALVQAVKEMRAAHVPMEVILDKLGDRVTTLVPAFKAYVEAVAASEAAMDNAFRVAEFFNAAVDEEARALERMNRHYEEAVMLSEAATKAQREWTRALEDFKGVAASLPIPRSPTELIKPPGTSTPDPLPTLFEKMQKGAKEIFGQDWVRNSTSAIVGVANAFGGKVAQIANQVSGVIQSLASGDIWGAIARGAGMIVDAITSAFGRGRRAANEFVQGSQNPTTDAIKALFTGLEDARAIGALTVSQTKAARAAFEQLWSNFQKEAAAAGVAGQQGLATMRPFVASWREWLDSLDEAARQMEHMNAIFEKAGEVTMAASGFQVLEDAIQALLDTGQSTAHIVFFLGDQISDMAEKMKILGIEIPPATQAMLDLIEATKAMERIEEIDEELIDVFDNLSSALNSKMDMIDQALATSRENIDTWTSEIGDLNDTIAEQSELLQDAKHWQEEYDDAIRESANELKRITEERKNTEERIATLTEQIERDRLTKAVEEAKKRAGITEDLIETITKGLTPAGHAFTTISRRRLLSGGEGGGDASAAQAALDAFEARVREQQRAARINELTQLQTALPQIITQQKAAELAYAEASVAAQEAIEKSKEELRIKLDLNKLRVEELTALIPLEKARVLLLEAEREATLALMEAFGIEREGEFDAINATIDGLIERARLLAEERAELERLPGVTAAASGAIATFIANLAAQAAAAQARAAQAAAPVPAPMGHIAGMTTPLGYTGIEGVSTDDPSLQAAIDRFHAYGPMASLPAYADGVANVPVDTIAKVHKGERIMSANDNESLILLLREIRDGVRSGHVINMDSQRVGTVISKAVEHGSVRFVASTLKR